MWVRKKDSRTPAKRVRSQHAEWIEKMMNISLDFSAKRKKLNPKYWWINEIASLRASCITVRKVFTGLKRTYRPGGSDICQAQKELKVVQKKLRLASERNKEKAWQEMRQYVNGDF